MTADEARIIRYLAAVLDKHYRTSTQIADALGIAGKAYNGRADIGRMITGIQAEWPGVIRAKKGCNGGYRLTDYGRGIL